MFNFYFKYIQQLAEIKFIFCIFYILFFTFISSNKNVFFMVLVFYNNLDIPE